MVFSCLCCCDSSWESLLLFLTNRINSSEYKGKFGHTSNCCKRVLEAAKLAYANKTITSQKLDTFLSLLNKGVFSIGITFVDIHLNWLNWFHFLIFKRGLPVILIDCMTLLSPFLDVTTMSLCMSTVSFLAL